MAHLAIYGNAKIPREYCKVCERWAFVLDGRIQCCDRLWNGEIKRLKRMVEAEPRRHLPPYRDRNAILHAQDHRCKYCDRPFGSFYWHRGRLRQIRIEWDHIVAFAYGQDNHTENYAAACQRCNGWKSDQIFQTIDEIRIYVANKWKIFLENGAEDVPHV